LYSLLRVTAVFGTAGTREGLALYYPEFLAIIEAKGKHIHIGLSCDVSKKTWRKKNRMKLMWYVNTLKDTVTLICRALISNIYKYDKLYVFIKNSVCIK